MEDRRFSEPGVEGDGEEVERPKGVEEDPDEMDDEMEAEFEGRGRPTPIPPYLGTAGPPPSAAEPSNDNPDASERALRGEGEGDARLRLRVRRPRGEGEAMDEPEPGDARVRGRRTRFAGDEEPDFGRMEGENGGGEVVRGESGCEVVQRGENENAFGMGVRSSSVDGSASMGGGAKVSFAG